MATSTIKELQDIIANAKKEITELKGGYNKTAGKNIRFYREAKNMSQAILAELAGLSLAQINNMEKGKANAIYTNIMMVCSALDVSPNQIAAIPGTPTTQGQDQA